MLMCSLREIKVADDIDLNSHRQTYLTYWYFTIFRNIFNDLHHVGRVGILAVFRSQFSRVNDAQDAVSIQQRGVRHDSRDLVREYLELFVKPLNSLSTIKSIQIVLFLRLFPPRCAKNPCLCSWLPWKRAHVT